MAAEPENAIGINSGRRSVDRGLGSHSRDKTPQLLCVFGARDHVVPVHHGRLGASRPERKCIGSVGRGLSLRGGPAGFTA